MDGLDTRTLATRAYDEICDAIVTGALSPGEEITERGLAQKLGVSPTPVREAFRMLEQAGLVERRGRSLIVSRLLETPPHELLRIEAALRGLAARLAAEKITEEGKAELRAITDELSAADPLAEPDALLEQASAFHDCVNRASRNPLLVQFLNTTYHLRRHLQVNRPPSELMPGDRRNRNAEHRAIAQAVLDENADLAERLAVEHTLSTAVNPDWSR